jgi:hypothetical protein
MLATLQPAGRSGVKRESMVLPPLCPTRKVPLSPANCTKASGVPPERITPLKIKPGGRLRGAGRDALVAKGAKGSTRPEETEATTWLELGRGVSPAKGGGALVGAGAGGGEVTSLVACGGFSPAQATSSRAAAMAWPRNLRVAGFNEITESVKVCLKLPGHNSTQNAWIHQWCQDPGQFIADTQLDRGEVGRL